MYRLVLARLFSFWVRRPHSTNQKVVQGKCPLHVVLFNGAVCSNTLFSNTSVLTNSLSFRANSACKGSRTPRLVEHFCVPILGTSSSKKLLVAALRPSYWGSPQSSLLLPPKPLCFIPGSVFLLCICSCHLVSCPTPKNSCQNTIDDKKIAYLAFIPEELFQVIPCVFVYARAVLAESILKCLLQFTLPKLFANYPRHPNYYMQLFLFSGINILMMTITITFLNP